MLLNRQRALAFFDQRYARSGAEFVVLYGRRRVGKTTLRCCNIRSFFSV
jgi:AAA+ ATPase superfamily predicted ATPase